MQAGQQQHEEEGAAEVEVRHGVGAHPEQQHAAHLLHDRADVDAQLCTQGAQRAGEWPAS